MLSIRMQRLGRKGHPMYRVVVQDRRQSPDSGKYVALLGSFDPHSKTVNLSKDKAEFYLKNGAQPSDRVVKLFKDEKIALPSWVKEPAKQDRKIRNPEKLRKNRPAGAPAPEKPAKKSEDESEKPAEETAPTKEAVETDAPVTEDAPPQAENTTEETKDEAARQPSEEQPVEFEKPAEETAKSEDTKTESEDQKA